MNTSVYFAYPGDLDTKTGGYGYDRQIISELRNSGWDVNLVPLGDGFPFPDRETLLQAGRSLQDLPENALVLIDGLAYGTFGKIASELAGKINLVALVHHPLASEGNIPEREQALLADSEKRALAQAKAVLVTSSSTRDQLIRDYNVPADRIAVAIPGTEPGIRAQRNSKIPLILSVGSVIPRKGHDVLVAALAGIKDLSWRCSIIGSRTMDAGYDTRLQQQIEEHQLADRVTLTGQVKDTRSEFVRSDIFALASRYEGYGMVFAEALSHGLPIVACRAGAVPEVVPKDAGVLVPPDDPEAFSNALRCLITDHDYARRMADASYRQGRLLPRWAETAKLFSAVFQQVTDERF